MSFVYFTTVYSEYLSAHVREDMRYDVYPSGTYNLKREKSKKYWDLTIKPQLGDILYACARAV